VEKGALEVVSIEHCWLCKENIFKSIRNRSQVIRENVLLVRMKMLMS
jgi:hypothetical protein